MKKSCIKNINGDILYTEEAVEVLGGEKDDYRDKGKKLFCI